MKWLSLLEKSDVIQELDNCDAFVLSSDYESMGLVYAEALAKGKPVIATKCGGPEGFINSSNGILVNRQDANQLADAMINIVSSIQVYDAQEISDSCRKRFSSKVICAKIMESYESVLGKV